MLQRTYGNVRLYRCDGAVSRQVAVCDILHIAQYGHLLVCSLLTFVELHESVLELQGKQTLGTRSVRLQQTAY